MAKKSTSSNKKSGSLSSIYHFNVFVGLFFVLAFAVVTTLSAYVSLAVKPSPPAITPNLSLAPSSAQVARGSTLSVQIWADSADQPVNAVQINLSYPVDKLNFVSIDTANSAFGVAAQNTGGNGVIDIARGATDPVSGRSLVATVKFTPLTAAKGKSKAVISFTPGTVLVSSNTNGNVLAATYNGSYSLN
jgi:hypothetical protein